MPVRWTSSWRSSRSPGDGTRRAAGPGMSRHRSRLTGWRRIASAMWAPPDDPQIYGTLDVDAAPALAFIEHARQAGHRVTPTHLVGRALAHALREVPDLNVQIRRGSARTRPSIDVFFITAVGSGHDLSGVKVIDASSKPVLEIADELARRAGMMKQGNDRDFARSKRLMDAMPAWLLRRLLRVTAFLSEDLGVNVPGLGLARSPFGSAMVTSVGMFGLQQGFAPLAWMYDVPLLLLVGEIHPRPVVVKGEVRARDILPISATIDHRYVDGWHVSHAMKAFRDYLAAPERFEPALPVLASLVAN
ncbi:MAG: 2-oxo acid dehydrogenase subunit E2 [Kofleriaceae bacterium]